MLIAALGLAIAPNALAQTASVAGVVRDETSGTLPGVSVELKGNGRSLGLVVTDVHGTYRFDPVVPGHYQISFVLLNFATARRDIEVAASGTARVDAVLHLALNADVTVTGKRTFANLADVEHPAENLVGIAQAASQGRHHRPSARRTSADARR